MDHARLARAGAGDARGFVELLLHLGGELLAFVGMTEHGGELAHLVGNGLQFVDDHQRLPGVAQRLGELAVAAQAVADEQRAVEAEDAFDTGGAIEQEVMRRVASGLGDRVRGRGEHLLGQAE